MSLTDFQASGERCPLCHSRHSLRASTVAAADSPEPCEDLRIIECGSCHFAWQWPIRRDACGSREFFDQVYNEAVAGTYFDPHRKEKISRLEYGFVEEFFAKPGRLLDIGAGDGTFCSVAAEGGWKAVGVDPALPRPHQSENLHFIRGTTDQVKEEAFDAVTMWDVIEHVPDPVALLHIARQKLKHSGLVFVETGNYLSFNRVSQGRKWWAYQLDHKWYFNPGIIINLLTRVGFQDPVLCRRVLRPEWRPRRWNALINHAKLVARRRPPSHHGELIRVGHTGWGSLDIFAIAARKEASD